jgi:AcrR family transcriptional regulator
LTAAAAPSGPTPGSGSSRPKVKLPLALSKLPPGQRKLPREYLLENQRTRLLAAALDVFGERGFVKTSVSSLIKEAGTSRTTFYSFYPDKEGCFLATYDLGLEWLDSAARDGISQSDSWPLQVRGATANVLSRLAGDPRLARVCAVEAAFAGPEVRARQREMFGTIAQGLRRGRGTRPGMKKLTDLFEPVLVGGASALVAGAVADGEAGSLTEFAPELTELLLTGYLGPAEARRVARGRD